jgi:hypothetical protein
MGVLDRQSVTTWLDRFGGEDFGSIDFARYSKSLNRSLRRYDFDVVRILAR